LKLKREIEAEMQSKEYYDAWLSSRDDYIQDHYDESKKIREKYMRDLSTAKEQHAKEFGSSSVD